MHKGREHRNERQDCYCGSHVSPIDCFFSSTISLLHGPSIDPLRFSGVGMLFFWFRLAGTCRRAGGSLCLRVALPTDVAQVGAASAALVAPRAPK